MIVTDGFKPAEFDGPNLENLAFIEHEYGLQGNCLFVMSKSGRFSGFWRFTAWGTFNHLVCPRVGSDKDYRTHYIFCAGKTSFVEWSLKVAEPIRDDSAEYMNHYRIVTDRFFFDFIASDLSTLELVKLPLPDPSDPWDDDEI